VKAPGKKGELFRFDRMGRIGSANAMYVQVWPLISWKIFRFDHRRRHVASQESVQTKRSVVTLRISIGPIFEARRTFSGGGFA
jgi:hypothetical protein